MVNARQYSLSLFTIHDAIIFCLCLTSLCSALVVYDEASHVYERHWIRYLFAEHDFPNLSKLRDPPNCTIFVTRQNSSMYLHMANFSNSKTFIWLHLSDESQTSHSLFAREYSRWYVVFRNYWSVDTHDIYDRLEAQRKLAWFPLGYGHNFATSYMPTRSPSHLLTFIGNTGNNPLRALHVQEIKGKGIDIYAATADSPFGNSIMNASVLTEVLLASDFCLNLPGASAECFRFYEALQCGCLPVIIDVFEGADYSRRNWYEFKHLLSINRVKADGQWQSIFDAGHTQFPVPFFWINNANDLQVLNTLSVTDKLHLKLETYAWWGGVKDHFKGILHERIAACTI